jgi:hypothetical protein
MDKEKKDQHLPPKNGKGRISNTGEERSSPENSPAQQRDISDIDRQEGEMQHGELGGNLNETISKES